MFMFYTRLGFVPKIIKSKTKRSSSIKKMSKPK
jgi:hypothetical protein